MTIIEFVLKIVSLFGAVLTETIKSNEIIEINPISFWKVLALSLKICLTNIPKSIGNNTIIIILINIDMKLNSIHCPPKTKVKKGVTIGAKKVEKIIIATEKVISPPPKKVITLAAVPGGIEPNKIKPKAKLLFNFKNLAIKKAPKIIKVYFAITPIVIYLGFFNIIIISLGIKVIPVPNIIIAKSKLGMDRLAILTLAIGINIFGIAKAKPVTNSIKIVRFLFKKSESFLIFSMH
nr:hypothetical protein [Miniphocaeibacter halophilus]